MGELPGDDERSVALHRLTSQLRAGKITPQEYHKRTQTVVNNRLNQLKNLEAAGLVVPRPDGFGHWVDEQADILYQTSMNALPGLMHDVKGTAEDLVGATSGRDYSFKHTRQLAKDTVTGTEQLVRHPNILTPIALFGAATGAAAIGSRVLTAGKIGLAADEIGARQAMLQASKAMVNPRLLRGSYQRKFFPQALKHDITYKGETTSIEASRNPLVRGFERVRPTTESRFRKAQQANQRTQAGIDMSRNERIAGLNVAENEVQHNPEAMQEAASQVIDEATMLGDHPEIAPHGWQQLWDGWKTIAKNFETQPTKSAGKLVDAINRSTVFAMLHIVPLKYVASNLPSQAWLSITSGALNPVSVAHAAKLYNDLGRLELSPRQFAEIHGLSEKEALHLAKNGEMPGRQLENGKWVLQWDARQDLRGAIGGGQVRSLVPREDQYTGPSSVWDEKKGKYVHAKTRRQRAKEFGSYAGDHPLSALGHLDRTYANGIARVLDEPFRFTTFAHHARQAGYGSAEDISRLLRSQDAETVAVRNTLVQRTNRDMIDYERMGRPGRDIMRRIVLFYPWIKGSTMYFGRWLREHPIQATVQMEMGQRARERRESAIGPVPSWLEGSMVVGSEKIPGLGKVPKILDTKSMGVISQGPEVARGISKSVFSQKSLLGEYVSPSIDVAALAMGMDVGHAREIKGTATDRLRESAIIQSPIPGIIQAFQKGGRNLNSIYPRSPEERAIGSALLGRGLYPQPLNPKKQREYYRRETLELLPSKQREQTKISFAKQDYIEAAAKKNIALPHEIMSGFDIQERRNVNRIGKKGKDAYRADAQTLREMRVLTADDERQLLEYIKLAPDTETGHREISDTMSSIFEGTSYGLLSTYGKALGVRKPATRPSRHG